MITYDLKQDGPWLNATAQRDDGASARVRLRRKDDGTSVIDYVHVWHDRALGEIDWVEFLDSVFPGHLGSRMVGSTVLGRPVVVA